GLIERNEEGALDFRLPTPEGLQIHLEVVRHFLIGRGVAVLAGERLTRGRDVAALAADRARHVILAAQLVQDGAAYPRRGERAEGQSASGVERVDGVHQADGAGADQLVEIDLYGQTAGELPGHVVHQTEVLGEQAIARERLQRAVRPLFREG